MINQKFSFDAAGSKNLGLKPGLYLMHIISEVTAVSVDTDTAPENGAALVLVDADFPVGLASVTFPTFPDIAFPGRAFEYARECRVHNAGASIKLAAGGVFDGPITGTAYIIAERIGD
jgi:hypothetical protein